MIADAHNDLLIELAFFREERNPFAERWLPQLEAGGIGLQVCALFAEGEALPREPCGRRSARLQHSGGPLRQTPIES